MTRHPESNGRNNWKKGFDTSAPDNQPEGSVLNYDINYGPYGPYIDVRYDFDHPNSEQLSMHGQGRGFDFNQPPNNIYQNCYAWFFN